MNDDSRGWGGRGCHLYKLVGHEPVGMLDVIEWAYWFEAHYGKMHVALDRVSGVRVSTVFLGIDANYSERGPPILFETMIFGGLWDGQQVRYATWDSAEAAHRVLVEKLRALGWWRAFAHPTILRWNPCNPENQ